VRRAANRPPVRVALHRRIVDAHLSEPNRSPSPGLQWPEAPLVAEAPSWPEAGREGRSKTPIRPTTRRAESLKFYSLKGLRCKPRKKIGPDLGAGPNPPKGGWRRHRWAREAPVGKQYESGNAALQGRKTGSFTISSARTVRFSFTFNYLRSGRPIPGALEQPLGMSHFGPAWLIRRE
jgi:hypothetical protein